MMSDATLFHGIAVIIDDQINDPTASIMEIRKAIEKEGCHVVPLAALPNEESVANLREVAFFVLDWKLWGMALKELGGGEEVEAPAGMVAAYEESNFKFLRDLKKVRFAPVFIFTDEDVDHIKEKLRQHKDLYDENDPSHILVMKKGEVSQAAGRDREKRQHPCGGRRQRHCRPRNRKLCPRGAERRGVRQCACRHGQRIRREHLQRQRDGA